jgi:hypothetical protein
MLETGRLLDLAREQSGLRDFGEEWFIEPLGWLVDSINQDCRLTPTGRQAIPGMLIRFLVNRLEVEHWYKLHPEIDDEEILAPVFGVGLPRTGSTALGHIMSLDPETRVLRKWESDRPCPPPEAATQHTDPRIAISQAAEDQFVELVPEVVDMLPRGVTSPTECAYPLMESFSAGSSFELFIHVPTYARKTLSPGFDMVPAYRYHKRLIKLLQWRCPPKRWYLRTPVHTFEIDSLSAVYPDARFVMTHRDPMKSLPSVCSLIEHHRRAFVENPEPEYVGATHEGYWATALERTLDFRDRVGEERFFDVSHRRQVIDPAEQVRALYEKLGWHYDESMEERIRAWQETHPRGKHSYSAEHFGLDPARITRDYRFYTERFATLL